LKIWAATNYIPKIPEHEKDAMYTRRLSLLHNIRGKPYPENSNLIYEIAESEGEKIVSWILNLPDEECVYEDPETVRKEWEKLASPEIEYLEKHWEVIEEDTTIPLIKIKYDYKKSTGNDIDIDLLEKTLHNLGYVIKNNVIKNIRALQKKSESIF
jgi:hypothetical protein